VSKHPFDAKKSISELVNKNAAPKLVGQNDDWQPLFDRRHDWKEDDRVAAAIAELVGHGEEALPELLKHFDDNEYCMTYKSSIVENADNYTVGWVCSVVADELLSEAHCRYVPDGDVIIYHLRYAVGGNEGLRAWCLARKEKKLYELQIEQCELVIPKILAAEDVDDSEKRKAVDSIRSEVKALQKRRVPEAPSRFGERMSLSRFNREQAEELRSKLANKAGRDR